MNPSAKKARLRYIGSHWCIEEGAFTSLFKSLDPLSNDVDTNDYNEDADGTCNDSDI